MQRKSILIVSDMNEDLHASVMASELRKRGEAIICLDPKDVASGFVSFDLHDQWDCGVRARDCCFCVSDVKSVLYRRPSPIVINENVELDYRNIVKEEWNYMMNGFWDLLEASGATLVSHPANIRRSETKIRQLQSAAALGLRCPKTMITNDKSALVEFYDHVRAPIVMKKLKTPFIVRHDRLAFFFTKVVRDMDEIDGGALSLCPVIFQEYIEKACDARIVVVGERVFGTKIFSQNDEDGRIDYREAGEKIFTMRHEAYEVPHAISEACRTMVNGFGLRFGAFDFIITPRGDHVFLELNPNGQWLWLQLRAEAKISDALCDLLCGLDEASASRRSARRSHARDLPRI